MKRWTVYATILATLILLALPAFAAKGGKHATSSLISGSITLDQQNPRLGDTVTFTTIHDPITGDVGRVAVLCWQDVSLVYQWTATESEAFTLWASGWQGPAHCTAELFYYIYRGQTQVGRVSLDATSFDVAA